MHCDTALDNQIGKLCGVGMMFTTTPMKVSEEHFDAPTFILFDGNIEDFSFTANITRILCVPPESSEDGNIAFYFYDNKQPGPICAFAFPPNDNAEEQHSIESLFAECLRVPFFVTITNNITRIEFLCDADSKVYECIHGQLH